MKDSGRLGRAGRGAVVFTGGRGGCWRQARGKSTPRPRRPVVSVWTLASKPSSLASWTGGLGRSRLALPSHKVIGRRKCSQGHGVAPGRWLIAYGVREKGGPHTPPKLPPVASEWAWEPPETSCRDSPLPLENSPRAAAAAGMCPGRASAVPARNPPQP